MSMRRMYSGLVLLGLMLAPAPVCARAAAQASPEGGPYWAPGLVRMLMAGEDADFPDNRVARRWLAGFRTGVWESCRQPPPDHDNAAMRRAGVDVIQAGFNLTSYMVSATPQRGDGVDDGRKVVAVIGCDGRARIALSISTIIFRNGAREQPDESDLQQFMALISPTARTDLGFAPDGSRVLDASLVEVREALAEAIERYLRTRQEGELSDTTRLRVAREIAEDMLFSGIPRSTFNAMMLRDFDGSVLLQLYPIPMRATMLTTEPSGTPFGPDDIDSALDRWAEDLWNRTFGRLNAQRNAEQSEAAALEALATTIRRRLPPELREYALAPSRPPAPLDPGVVTIATEAGRELNARLGLMRCAAPDPGRFNRMWQTEIRSMAIVKVIELPLRKPNDPTEYTVNGPFDAPVARWNFSSTGPWNLDWDRATRENRGDCVLIRVPAAGGAATVRVEEERGLMSLWRAGLGPPVGMAYERSMADELWFVTTPDRATTAIELLSKWSRALEEYQRTGALPSDMTDSTDADAATGTAAGASDASPNGLTCSGSASAGPPAFTPFTAAPAIANARAVASAIQQSYPPDLRDQGIGGSPIFSFHVTASGEVDTILLNQSSGFPALDEAACSAAKLIEFSPATNRGEPVAVWINLPVRFDPGAGRPLDRT